MLRTLGMPLFFLDRQRGEMQNTYHHFVNFEHEDSKLKTALEFILKLFGGAHKVTFGNRELAYTDKTVHFAGSLVTEKS